MYVELTKEVREYSWLCESGYSKYLIWVQSHSICLFCDWLISLSIISSRFISMSEFSSFLRLNNIPLCVLPHFAYPFICWWTQGCFLLLAVVDNATENYGKGYMGRCLMDTEVQFLQDETNSEDSTAWRFLIPLNCTVTISCHFMHIRMAFIKKARKKQYWWECGKEVTLVHWRWECKLLQPLWKIIWSFHK